MLKVFPVVFMNIIDWENLISLLIIAWLGCSFAKGYKRGFAKELSYVLSWGAGFLFCRPLAAVISKLFGSQINGMIYSVIKDFGLEKISSNVELSQNIWNVGYTVTEDFSKRIGMCLIYMISFAIISVVVDAIIYFLRTMERIPLIGLPSRLLGGLCGTIKIVFLIWLIYMLLIITAGMGIDFAADTLRLLNQSQLFQFINKGNIVNWI